MTFIGLSYHYWTLRVLIKICSDYVNSQYCCAMQCHVTRLCYLFAGWFPIGRERSVAMKEAATCSMLVEALGCVVGIYSKLDQEK